MRHARTASPYYRRLYHGLPPKVTDPLVLPPVGKRDLMAHFDEWVTDPEITLDGIRQNFLSDLSKVGSAYLGRYHVFTTSGTTGEPAILLHDRASWQVMHVVSRFRARGSLGMRSLLPQLRRRGIRSAVLFATGGHFGGVALTESTRRRSTFLARRVRVFSVLQPLPQIVEELNGFQPTLIGGYPSAMAMLAAEQRAGRLSIHPLRVTATGETMTAAMRRDIETVFGCPVIEGYGASEVPALAVQCVRGALHVNTDWYLLEPVNEHYRPVPPGTLSHTVLVTNLANRVQPVIRYDLGDRVELSATGCPCGSAFPTVTVEGRTNDVLAFELPDGRVVRLLPLALGTVIEETPGVRRFQAIRTGPTTLTVALEPSPGAEPGAVWTAVEDRLRKFLGDHGADAVVVEPAPAPPAPDPRSGKFRQVWSV
ncbi:MAG TPA: phenylacetate--CoA ligase family protein [Oryzihumus sp.]|nr:phenylacetate--CoA ligase family protein [Oryzihumus sp.]